MQNMSFDPSLVKDWVFPVIEAIAAIATIILVLIVWRQMRQTDQQLKMTQNELAMTKHQMDSSLRPWIGTAELIIASDSMLHLLYSNFGSLPATSSKLRYGSSSTEVKRADLAAFADVEEGGVLLPDQKKFQA